MTRLACGVFAVFLFWTTTAWSLTFYEESPGDFRVSWTADVVPPYTEFRLLQSTNGGSSFSTVYSGIASFYVANNPAAGTYIYKVTGCGNFEDPFEPGMYKWLCLPLPTSPSQLSVTVAAPPSGLNVLPIEYDGTASLTWNSSSGATSYEIEKKEPGSSSWTSAGSATGTSKTVSTTAEGEYEFRVTACASICSEPSGTSYSILVNTDAIYNEPSISSTTAVGTTPFSAFVDPKGNSRVNIPLRTPPGVNGLQPNLTLAYSSGDAPAVGEPRVKGPLGYGWSLQGIPKIERCRVGTGGSIAYGYSDSLCLNGVRLVHENGATGSGYWANGSVYYTEIESFTKVTASGSGVAGRWFTVEMSNGHTILFGNTADSRVERPGSVPYEWHPTTHTDAYGNELTYTWHELGALGTAYLTNISYGGSEVRFRYGERCTSTSCDTLTVIRDEVGPSDIHQGVVLNRILTRASNKWVNDYRLDSEYGNGYVRLERVQNCAYPTSGSGSKCMTPLDIKWEILGIFDDQVMKDQNVVYEIDNSFGDSTTFEHKVIDGNGTSNHSYHNGGSSWFGTSPLPSTAITDDDLQRAIVYWIKRPDGVGSQSVEYYRYNGYPLYDSQGRGFLGFKSTRRDFRYYDSYDIENDVTFSDARRLIYSQYRLDFPFIGRESRRLSYVDEDSTSSFGSNGRTERKEWGWEATSLRSGRTEFVHPSISYDREIEINANFGTNSYNVVETEYDYCFRALSSGTCPSSGTLLDQPTQLVLTERTAKSPNAQNFGSVWGEVGARSLNSQSGLIVRTIDYDNTSSASAGQIDTIEVGYGTTSVSITQSAAYTRDELNSRTITAFPGDTHNERTHTISYDSLGHQVSLNTVGSNVSSRTRTAGSFTNSRYPTLVTNEEGHQKTIAYDHRFGSPATITDPNGLVTTITRDQFGRIISNELPDGTTTSITYEDCSSGCSQVTWAVARMKVITEVENGSTQISPATTEYFDTAGNRVLVETEAFDSTDGVVRVEQYYNDVGQLMKESLPYYSVGGAPKYVEYGYDPHGRKVLVNRPDGSKTKTKYVGSYGWLTVDIEETGTGLKKQLRFNPKKELVWTIDGVGSTDAVQTDYTYTVRGQLDTVTVDGKEVLDLDYDSAGNHTSVDQPSSGQTTFLYDALGQLIQSTDAIGQKTQFTYDFIGRLEQRVDGYLGSNPKTNTWVWDTATNGIGVLALRSTTGFSETYTYTSSGQLNTVTADVNVAGFSDNSNYVLDYDYTAGRVSSASYPNLTIDYVYGSRGHLSQVKQGSNVLHEYEEFDAFGNPTLESFGNGLETAKTYDPDTGRLTAIETGTPSDSDSVQDLIYQWRTDGSLLSRTDAQGTSSTGDDVVESFDYDDLARLDQADIPGGRTLDFDYDDFGGLTTKTSDISGDLDVGSFGYSSSTTRLSSAQIAGVSNSFSYDANGNITRYDAANGDDLFIDYDSGNRATEITLGSSQSTSTPTARDEFWYGPDGQRFLRKATWDNSGTQATAWTLYLWGGVFEEAHPEYDSTRDYRQRVQVTDSVLIRWVKPSSSSGSSFRQYTYRDHLGSLSVLTGSGGTVVREMAYDPFGGRRDSDWSQDIASSDLEDLQSDADVYTARGFTDHEHLSRTGIIHMNGRIFDARVGRFLQPDPLVPDWTSSQSYNSYSYVLNNPGSLTDPSGFGPPYEDEVVVVDDHHFDYPEILYTDIEYSARPRPVIDFEQDDPLTPSKPTVSNVGRGYEDLFTGFGPTSIQSAVELSLEGMFGIFGVSTSSGEVIDPVRFVSCSVRTTCGRVGIGVYGGVGSDISVMITRPLQTGTVESSGLVGRIGLGGFSGGASISWGDHTVGAAKTFVGAGTGAVIAYQRCESEIRCDED